MLNTHRHVHVKNELDLVARDEEGYLMSADDWSPELIEPLAAEFGVEMTAERLELVHFIRRHFEENASVPEARTVLKYMSALWGKDKATRGYLYTLFPYGYGQQACKIAGMRKPCKLMLDV